MPGSRPEEPAQAGGPGEARPRHPYVVLAAALVLPGSGHVLNGNPTRGLIMLFYIVLLGIVTAHFAAADQSILARYAGGWFVYAVSVIDAYRAARYRWERYRRFGRTAPASDGG